MTKDPVCIDAGSPVIEAAKAMRDSDIGPVIVLDGDSICGMVTDRDITLRVVAEGKDASSVKLGEICSKNPTTISPHDGIDEALQLMKDNAVRRLPVVEDGRPVGIVAIADLASPADVDPAIDSISQAAPNN
jgi:CBS domain-containing protein